MGNTDFFLNTEFEKQKRLMSLTGVRHEDCTECWKVEDSGAISMRLRDGNNVQEILGERLLHEFGTTDLQEISKSVDINSKILESTYIDRAEIVLSNLCDLQCVYCNENSSTQWALRKLNEKSIELSRYKTVNLNIQDNVFVSGAWQWINTSKNNIRSISILGGEPTIMPEFYVYMDKLMDIYKDFTPHTVQLSIVTNLNTPEKQFVKFLEYIEKLSTIFRVYVSISMESIGTQAEFIRTKLKWDNFEKNVHLLMSSNVHPEMITIHPVINLLAIPRFVEFLKWHKALIDKYNKFIGLPISMVATPKYLFAFNLPASFSVYIDYAINFMENNQYRNKIFKQDYINFLKSIKAGILSAPPADPYILKKFYTEMEKTSKILNVNFADVFPELGEFYIHCKNL
jgi:organic radical activating enzyme